MIFKKGSLESKDKIIEFPNKSGAVVLDSTLSTINNCNINTGGDVTITTKGDRLIKYLALGISTI